MKIKKPLLLIDLDGVTVDIEASAVAYKEQHPFVQQKDIYDLLNFEDMKPINHALKSIKYLSQHFEVYFCSTSPWENPAAWTEKRLWVGKYAPEMKKRLILTHRKDLVMGDYLIDDRTANGAGSFSGELIMFGSKEFPDWRKIVFYLCEKEQIVCSRCMSVSYDITEDQSFCKSCLNKLYS